MWCSACSWLVEEILTKTRGILEVKASFLSDTVRVRYLPHELTPQEITRQISRLGYHPSFLTDDSKTSTEKRSLLICLGISSVVTANIMMISMTLYTGFIRDLDPATLQYLSYPLWLLSTFVLFYGGLPMLRRSWAGICSGRATMDSLILLGSFSAYGYSIVQLFRGSIHLYFDTASMLITLVLIGKYIERNSREKVSKGIAELYELIHQKVHLSTTVKEQWVSQDLFQPGQEFLVLAGERIPLDGRISAGEADVDDSILTGEPMPKKKRPGDEVMAGTLLLEGQLTIHATRVGRNSSLGQMVELMQEALDRKDPLELFADRAMQWLVPAIIILAAGTALYLLSQKAAWDVALLRAVTVLVITCPCALGIAVPLAKVAAIGKARAEGILIRDPEALEQTRNLDVLVFDKTGTLTHGRYLLQEIVSPGLSEPEILGLLASVESRSDHFLAREIVRRAKERSLEIRVPEEVQLLEGLGVKGRIEGSDILIGSRRLLEMEGISLPADLDHQAKVRETGGMTLVFFAREKKAQGFLVFGDSLKEGAWRTVRELRRRNMDLWLVSGDSRETTRSIAGQLQIRQFLGQALPADKVQLIRSLQQKGKRVGMVGDGLNDAASLAQADVGIALGPAGNLTREASDITLLSGDPSRVLETLDLSGRTMKIIRENLFFAFFYNCLGIPLAVAGLLNPLVAVSAMVLSSLTVIGNTLRILRGTPVT
jgi:heavy metal translocating P-type ATPase